MYVTNEKVSKENGVPSGFEPETSGLLDRCSYRLSYGKPYVGVRPRKPLAFFARMVRSYRFPWRPCCLPSSYSIGQQRKGVIPEKKITKEKKK